MMNAESSSDQFSEKLRDTVQRYLNTEGWQVGVVAAPDAQWVLTANDSQGRHIRVVHPQPILGQTDTLVILTGLQLSPGHKSRYANLTPEQKRDLIFDLRHQIILLGAGYVGLLDPLERMVFEDVVYFDGLTKNSFLQSVRKVRNATILARTIIARRFNEPPPPEPEMERRSIGFHIPEREST